MDKKEYQSTIQHEAETGDWVLRDLAGKELYRNKEIQLCLDVVWSTDMGDTLVIQPY